MFRVKYKGLLEKFSFQKESRGWLEIWKKLLDVFRHNLFQVWFSYCNLFTKSIWRISKQNCSV